MVAALDHPPDTAAPLPSTVVALHAHDQGVEDDQAPAAAIDPVSDGDGAPLTMSPHDPHPDHAAAGAALLAAWRDGEVAACRFHWPVPVVSADHGEPVAIDPAAAAAQRAALAEYERWDPDQGRYAIGALSVADLIEAQRTSPTERTHAADAPPPPGRDEG